MRTNRRVLGDEHPYIITYIENFDDIRRERYSYIIENLSNLSYSRCLVLQQPNCSIKLVDPLLARFFRYLQRKQSSSNITQPPSQLYHPIQRRTF